MIYCKHEPSSLQHPLFCRCVLSKLFDKIGDFLSNLFHIASFQPFSYEPNWPRLVDLVLAVLLVVYTNCEKSYEPNGRKNDTSTKIVVKIQEHLFLHLTKTKSSVCLFLERCNRRATLRAMARGISRIVYKLYDGI